MCLCKLFVISSGGTLLFHLSRLPCPLRRVVCSLPHQDLCIYSHSLLCELGELIFFRDFDSLWLHMVLYLPCQLLSHTGLKFRRLSRFLRVWMYFLSCSWSIFVGYHSSEDQPYCQCDVSVQLYRDGGDVSDSNFCDPTSLYPREGLLLGNSVAAMVTATK